MDWDGWGATLRVFSFAGPSQNQGDAADASRNLEVADRAPPAGGSEETCQLLKPMTWLDGAVCCQVKLKVDKDE